MSSTKPDLTVTLMSCRDYAGACSERWCPVYPQIHVARQAPHQQGSIPIDFAPLLSTVFPEIGVLEVTQGTIVGPNGLAIAKGRYLLPESSWYGWSFEPPSSSEVHTVLDTWPHRHLPGVCVSLASEWGWLNYTHFVLDCLPRFHLVMAAGYLLKDVDFFYVPKPPSATAVALLSRLGLPAEKCIWAADRELISADTLIVTSFPGLRRNYPVWVPRFLRSLLKDSPSVPFRRLYLHRTTRSSQRGRTILNEDRISRVALDSGFQIYEHIDGTDEPLLFSESKCIIGPHDAGLGNLAFCGAASHAMEIVPTDHVFPYYYTVAESAGVSYSYLGAKSTSQRPPGSAGPSPYNFHVSEDEFRKAVRAIVEDT